MYQLTHEELISLIRKTAKETAIETIETYKQFGSLISAADIIRDIGIDLYNEGVKTGKLNPQRKADKIKGKRWVTTSEFLRFKAEIFN